MMLFKQGSPAEQCDEFMFEGQQQIQKIFVLIGLCCIPLMLLGKPLYLMATKKNKDVSSNCYYCIIDYSRLTLNDKNRITFRTTRKITDVIYFNCKKLII